MALAVLLAVCGAGCPKAPSLKFSAIPPFICKGQTTNLSWETDASGATIVAAPTTASLGQVGARDTRQVAPSETTTFTITAANGSKSSTARQEVSVVDAGNTQRVQLDPKGWDSGAAIYETDVPADRWPAIVQAGSVTLSSALPFDLVVEHGGKTAMVAKGATTATLAGTSFAGHYRGVLKAPTPDDALDAIVLPISVNCSP
jgi:hypothetical protein